MVREIYIYIQIDKYRDKERERDSVVQLKVDIVIDRVRQRGIELVRLIEGDTNMDTLRYGGGLIERGKDREVYGER